VSPSSFYSIEIIAIQSGIEAIIKIMDRSGTTGIHHVMSVFKVINRIPIDDVLGEGDIISFAVYRVEIFAFEIDVSVISFEK